MIVSSKCHWREQVKNVVIPLTPIIFKPLGDQTRLDQVVTPYSMRYWNVAIASTSFCPPRKTMLFTTSDRTIFLYEIPLIHNSALANSFIFRCLQIFHDRFFGNLLYKTVIHNCCTFRYIDFSTLVHFILFLNISMFNCNSLTACAIVFVWHRVHFQ